MSAPGKRARKHTEENESAAEAEAGRGRKSTRISVKLTGAGNYSRTGDSESGSGEPNMDQPSASPTDADVNQGAELSSAPAANTAGGKFEVGDVVILHNGSLCYEAEVVEAALTEVSTSKKGGAGRRKEAESPHGMSYLIRYTKWARRPEEWVADSFVHTWSEALAKGATNRPPRKLMWVGTKGSAARVSGISADDALDDPEDDSKTGDADFAKAEGRRSGRAPKPAATSPDPGAGADEAGRKRQRKPTEKAAEKGKEEAVAR
mmetsp:Transcript_35681/g.93675  ORF Transcript_35681/g.93675 Transcript_35681/m.93675 type:complete len:263 (+) Transcript_35681:2232-3020(+)